MHDHFHSRPSFWQARLARDHHLGLPLTTGIIAVLCLSALFALIAANALSPGALPELDQSIAQWFHVRATPAVTLAAFSFTHLHGTIGICTMSALLALWLMRRRAWVWLLTLVMSVPGGMLFNYGLKHLFQRVRPQFEQPLLVLHSYSFPSGHTIGAALFYSVLAAWLMSMHRQPGRRVLIAGAAIVMTALTALSRLYLGAHFLSDVLAAMLEGLGWFAFWATIIFTAQRHQSARMSSN